MEAVRTCSNSSSTTLLEVLCNHNLCLRPQHACSSSSSGNCRGVLPSDFLLTLRRTRALLSRHNPHPWLSRKLQQGRGAKDGSCLAHSGALLQAITPFACTLGEFSAVLERVAAGLWGRTSGGPGPQDTHMDPNFHYLYKQNSHQTYFPSFRRLRALVLRSLSLSASPHVHPLTPLSRDFPLPARAPAAPVRAPVATASFCALACRHVILRRVVAPPSLTPPNLAARAPHSLCRPRRCFALVA